MTLLLEALEMPFSLYPLLFGILLIWILSRNVLSGAAALISVAFIVGEKFMSTLLLEFAFSGG
jgi:hypothetical protein